LNGWDKTHNKKWLVIERSKNSDQIKTSINYKGTKNNIEYFTKGKDKHFSEIDVSFLLTFEEYL